ncbi:MULTISPECIES: HAD family hydrolase [unclassified Legionella]|uniref:HAD family hydrolase n=1 Tax=unclassified Legionella TaxID=2622702 RepID=UPI0010564A38|nr:MULTISPECIES: HAD-IIIA family hydrolase [unclassified Legionella]MDI9819120.1 HAD-IIIA family hydrolase [Legionella sp. PL877]
MGKLYRLVVFDWEGTLGDTLGQIFNSVAMEAKRLNFGEVDEQLARQSVELGLVKALRKVFPHLTEEQHEQLLQAVQQSLISRTTDVFLIPGAKAFIKRLHEAGIHIAIATNKGYQSLQRVLHISGLDAFFKVTRSAGQAPAKPCPQMLEEILAEFAVSADETLMIGDSATDMEMATNIGVDAVAVDFYHQQKEALLVAGAMAVFDDYERLADYLQLSEGGRK